MSRISRRWARKSVMTRIRALLTAPPSGAPIANPYTLYDLPDMRALAKGLLTPVRPYAFVIEGRVRPGKAGFPLVMTSVGVKYGVQELGRTTGGVLTAQISVVGRTSAEKDDLADLFAQNFGRELPLYSYSSGSALLIENGRVDPEISVWDEMTPDALRDEGTYDYWEVVEINVSFLQ